MVGQVDFTGLSHISLFGLKVSYRGLVLFRYNTSISELRLATLSESFLYKGPSGVGNSGSLFSGNEETSPRNAPSSSFLLLNGGSGIVGGQNSVALGAVPPYFSST